MKTQELDTVLGGPCDFEMILFIAAFYQSYLSATEHINERKANRAEESKREKTWTYIIVCCFFFCFNKENPLLGFILAIIIGPGAWRQSSALLLLTC